MSHSKPVFGQEWLNIHPQRWTDKPLPWVKELVWQNVKNLVKKYFFVSRKALRVHGDTKG